MAEKSTFRSGRAASIIAGLTASVWLVFLMLNWKHQHEALNESFWGINLFAIALYSTVQQWTLATETGRGGAIAATVDKFVALMPGATLVITWVALVAWNHSLEALSLRLAIVSIFWFVYPVVDFFATDVTNQRLRQRTFGVGADSGNI
jgi:hypothetical protein